MATQLKHVIEWDPRDRPGTAPDRADSPPSRDEPSENLETRPPGRLYAIAAALSAWLVVPWWLMLEPTRFGNWLFAVLVAFAVIAFGIVTISLVRAVYTRPRTAKRSRLSRRLDTASGPLPLRQAFVQLLLIPGAVAVAFTVIGWIDVIERVAG